MLFRQKLHKSAEVRKKRKHKFAWAVTIPRHVGTATILIILPGVIIATTIRTTMVTLRRTVTISVRIVERFLENQNS